MTRTNERRGWALRVCMIGATAALAGCGYTDLEMAAKQRQIDALVSQVNALKAGTSATCPGDVRPSTRLATSRALSSR